MKKKTLAAVLALAVAASLAACGSTESNTGDTTPAADTEQASETAPSEQAQAEDTEEIEVLDGGTEEYAPEETAFFTTGMAPARRAATCISM